MSRLKTKTPTLNSASDRIISIFLFFAFFSVFPAKVIFAEENKQEVIPVTESAAPKPESATPSAVEPPAPNAVEPAAPQPSVEKPKRSESAAASILSMGKDDEEEDQAPKPIVINGDVIEYSTDSRNVTVTGNAEVDYKGAKLTCDKLILDTLTKDCTAESNVRLDDPQGVIEGSRMVYNFESKKGTIMDANFRSNPYFIRAQAIEKVSDLEFVAKRGYATTCSLDKPHWRIKSKKVDIFPGDKIQTKDDTFYIGAMPLVNIPHYNHSLRDPLMHVQLMGGQSKEWGQYFLTAWRANLTDNINTRIYFDYRAQKGVAEGFGTDYTSDFGKGNFKFYYTQERDHKLSKANSAPRVFERYMIRLRHKWVIDPRTDFFAEYNKVVDSKRALYSDYYNFLKDYFYREYEKDEKPLSYFTIHHNFNYASLDLIMQQRVNRWYSQAEMLPQLTYTLPSTQVLQTPFYFQNTSSYVNYNYKNAVPSPSWDDITYNNYDTSNKFSVPVKLAFFNLNPFLSAQAAYNDNSKNLYHRTLYINLAGGTDISTKFYRLFNIKTNFLGLDINNLRHIVSPSVAYTYSKNSTMQARDIRIGGGASVSSSVATIELSNKLQTKRQGQSVDLVDLLVSSSYSFKPKAGEKRGSSFGDVLFKLKFLPYSWLEIVSDATYKHTGQYDEGYNCFSDVNYEFDFKFGPERSAGYEQRYQRKGGNEQVFSFNWRLNPKWKVAFYQRFNRGHDPTLKRGLREQEYTLTRDFHCWEGAFTYNVKRGYGETIWLIFRLKAFPEMEFNYNQEYHQPKPGSQSNP